mgnify:CR=1 FL=1
MGRLNNMPLTRIIELELEKGYEQSLTYAMAYGSGWERAQEAYRRLRAFKGGLAEMGTGAAASAEAGLKKAA